MNQERCPQCGSTCGPLVCRFSGITHKLFRENQYADAMIRRDKERGYPNPRAYEVEYSPMGEPITHRTTKKD